jgi:hypothetical protein
VSRVCPAPGQRPREKLARSGRNGNFLEWSDCQMGRRGSDPKPGLFAVYDARSTPRGLPFRVIHCHCPWSVVRFAGDGGSLEYSGTRPSEGRQPDHATRFRCDGPRTTENSSFANVLPLYLARHAGSVRFPAVLMCGSSVRRRSYAPISCALGWAMVRTPCSPVVPTRWLWLNPTRGPPGSTRPRCAILGTRHEWLNSNTARIGINEAQVRDFGDPAGAGLAGGCARGSGICRGHRARSWSPWLFRRPALGAVLRGLAIEGTRGERQRLSAACRRSRLDWPWRAATSPQLPSGRVALAELDAAGHVSVGGASRSDQVAVPGSALRAQVLPENGRF